MFDMLELLKILVLLAFASLYAYFDVFNKRNIPDKFVYLSIAVGIVFTLLNPVRIIIFSFLIAIFIGAAGYLLYKAGLLGLGDGLEFAFISLMLPIQPQPMLSMPQFGLPFVLSVFISSGIATVIVIPLYYILKEKKLEINTRSIEKAALVFASYMLLLMLIYFLFGAREIAVLLILILAVFSTLLFTVENTINKEMVRWVYPKEIEEGDIIAVGLLSGRDLRLLRAKSKHFGKLADKRNIAELKGLRKRLPVYKNAVPFSLFILAGVVLSLIIGDPLLLIFL